MANNRHLTKTERGQILPEMSSGVTSAVSESLLSDLRHLVLAARNRVAITVNSEAISLCWGIGCRIKEDILKGGRGKYGEATIRKCSEFLTAEFGSGWGVQTVRHCVRAAYTFSKKEIVYAMRTHLSWTHLRSLMGLKAWI